MRLYSAQYNAHKLRRESAGRVGWLEAFPSDLKSGDFITD